MRPICVWCEAMKQNELVMDADGVLQLPLAIVASELCRKHQLLRLQLTRRGSVAVVQPSSPQLH